MREQRVKGNFSELFTLILNEVIQLKPRFSVARRVLRVAYIDYFQKSASALLQVNIQINGSDF